MQKFRLPYSAILFRDGLACVETWHHDARNWEYGYMSPRQDWYTFEHYLRLNYVVVPDHPNYVLPEDVPCTPAYRIEFNAWALEFFGTFCSVEDGMVKSVDYDRRGLINERTFKNLLADLNARYPVRRKHEHHI